MLNITRSDNIVTPDQDNRKYRGLLLENGMKVILVSDATTDKAAAALDVQVGYMSDSDTIPGLSHFLEHMLFLGTEKYPSENEYKQYVSEHGGSSNAYTSTDHTNYYFDVKPSSLQGALDRFAQFFLKPLFTASATARELNAVDSEHSSNLMMDHRRLYQLGKHTSQPGHPYTKFGTGNRQTLETTPNQRGIDVRKELLKFHQKWYSSNIMSLVVLGKEPLDELEKLVVALFSTIENKNVEAPQWLEHPYGPAQLGIRILAVPVKDLRSLKILFPYPDMTRHYKVKPGAYVGRLLGHEGRGSLFSQLRIRGLVNCVDAGPSVEARGLGFFHILFALTEKGINHVDDIVNLTFQAAKGKGTQEWLFNERSLLSALNFRFKDKETPLSYVSYLAAVLRDYPVEDVLSGEYLVSEWKPEMVESVLDMLVPQNSRIVVVSKIFESDVPETEPWYGTRYRIDPIEVETITGWQNAGINEVFHLPPKNDYIPENLDLVPREETNSEFPVMIRNTQLTRAWFKQDQEFLLPKAEVKIEFFSRLVAVDPFHVRMACMMCNLVQDALNEETYNASLAGLHYEVSWTTYGIELEVGGYSDKLPLLLSNVMEKLTKFQVDSKRFEVLKEILVRSLRNYRAEEPREHSRYYTNLLLLQRTWTIDEHLSSANELTLTAVQDFVSRFFSQLHLEFLVCGNLSREQANGIVESVQNCLLKNCKTKPMFASQLIRDREYQLPDGSNILYKAENSVHADNCVSIYLQCGLQETHSNMLLELLDQVMDQPCFNTLRTQEQLGYIVSSSIRRSCGVQGLKILLQSEKDVDYVDGRIEAFLHSVQVVIESMSVEEFERHKAALASRVLVKPKSLGARAYRYWSEIICGQCKFDRDNTEVAYLEQISKEELSQFYKDFIVCDAPNRRKIAVHVVSNVPRQEGAKENCMKSYGLSTNDISPGIVCSTPTLVEDVPSFKSSLGLYPRIRPAIDISPSSTSVL